LLQWGKLHLLKVILEIISICQIDI